MNKTKKKKIAITAGVLIILFIILNFGLNIWLKYQLPTYIKKNTDYSLIYDKMDVDLGTGNIHITELKMNTKHPNDLDVLFLQGSIKDLKISRFGIWAALFNKEIYPSDIRIEQPNIKVRLAKKQNAANSKKSKLKFDFDNIEIINGNITVNNSRDSKIVSLSNLSLLLKGFKKNIVSKNDELPFEFDEFKMSGVDVFVRPTDEQLITAKSVVSKDKNLSILNFKLTPLLTQKQFQRYYPQKKQQIKLIADGIYLSELKAKSNKITLQNFKINNPDITLIKGRLAEDKKQKSMPLEVAIAAINLNQCTVKVVDGAGLTKLLVKKFNIKGEEFLFDEGSAKEKVPFRYKILEATGSNVQVDTDRQGYSIGSFYLSPTTGTLKQLVAKTTQQVEDKMSSDFTAKTFSYKVKDWSFVESKLKLDIEEVNINGLIGSVRAPVKTIKKVAQESGMIYPLIVQKIQIQNSDFTYVKNNLPLALKGLHVNLNDVEIHKKKDNTGTYLTVGDYNFRVNQFNYRTKFYELSAALLKGSKTNISLNNFKMLPRYTRSQFIRMIPVEQDLYTIFVPTLSMKGSWDFFSDNPFVKADQLIINNMDANIFRSKIPNDDPKVKPMYSELLRRIKFPFQISTTRIENSKLVYEEDTEKSNGPGKLIFSHFNMDIANLNSGKKGMATKVPIKINCRFMDVSPMVVDWGLDTSSTNDAFNIKGSISSLPANHINAFIEPYLKVRAAGSIQNLAFDLNGNKTGIKGSMRMKHHDLKISILNKEGEKNKLLSSIANVFVKSNSKKFPETVTIDKVERDPSKSFFNLFWKGIQEGLKKTLI